MNYVPLSNDDKSQMLDTIGADSIESLLRFIPKDIYLDKLDLSEGISEYDALSQLKQLAEKNVSVDKFLCFLGAGAYDHFVPAIVPALALRGEFATAYTPYQPEASQGTLQATFEYQSMIAQLTGLEVSNASLYDGGSACAEAVLMMATVSRERNELLVAGSVNPLYVQVVRTYTRNIDLDIRVVPCEGGVICPDILKSYVSDKTCGLIIQSPNFFGCIEDILAVSELVHTVGAFVVQVCNPVSLGILSSPAENGVDLAVGEGQPLGVDLAFGGPYLGFIASTRKFLRQLPGRIVGMTKDSNAKRCFVLTLQAREQHIRREKATSNICTNQALIALQASIFLTWLGREGIVELGNQNIQRAHYSAKKACQLPGVSLYYNQPFFNEFLLRIDNANVAQIISKMQDDKIFGGVNIRKFGIDLPDGLLVAVTEKRSRDDIRRWARALQNALDK